jgi:hypothetical protein
MLELHALLTLTVSALATLDTAFQIAYPSPDDSSMVALPASRWSLSQRNKAVGVRELDLAYGISGGEL